MNHAVQIAIFCLFLGGAMVFIASDAAAMEIGEVIEPITFETLDGHPRIMNNYDKRRGTVVVFLSARCESTAKQLRAINTAHEKYREREVLFVGVCSNGDEDGAELRAFLQNNGCIFPIYRDPSGEVARRLGATVTPEFYLVDAQGRLLYHGALEGAAGEGGLEQAIEGLLSGKRIKTATTPVEGTPISQLGAKRDIPDSYGSMAFSSELIFTKIPDVAVHHCSTVTQAPNGDILCLWYAGSYESAEDQALYLARQESGSRNWTEPKRLVVNPEAPPGNAIIFTDPNQRLWIVWGRMEGSRPVRRGSGWSQCRLMTRTSDDNGTTWTEDIEVPNSFAWLPRNAPLRLQSGAFVLPLSGHVDGKYGSFLVRVPVEPSGEWERIGFIPGGEQPTVVQRDNGDLLCLMRGHPRILQSVSKDDGKTWSKPVKTELKCPDSGIAMTRLKSGRILLAYNDTDQSDRTPFNIIQSHDGGETWKDMKIIEADWGEFSYPCLIQSADEMVHLTYTYRRYAIKHATFDEGWLTHLERPN